jgi:hypothetical protein
MADTKALLTYGIVLYQSSVFLGLMDVEEKTGGIGILWSQIA